MARSQSNLTLGIGVDTGQFIADAAIIRNELRGIKREVDAAARAGDVPRLQQLASEQERLEKSLIATQRARRGATQADKEAIPILTQLVGAYTLLHSKTTLVTGAISGLVFGLVRLASSAAKSIDALEDVAEAAGITVTELQAMQLAGAKVGATAEDVNQGLLRATRAIGDAREQAKATADAYRLMDSAQQAAFDREEMDKWRAGVTDNSNAFTRLRIDVTKFAATTEGNRALLRAVAIELDKESDAAKRASIAQDLFGKAWSKQIELIKAGKDSFAEAAKSIIPLTDAERAASSAWLAASAEFSNAWTRVQQTVGTTIGTAIVPIINNLTQFLTVNMTTWRQLASIVTGAITTVQFAVELLWLGFNTLVNVVSGNTAELGAAADQFVADWSGAFEWFGKAVNTVLEWFDWIIAKAKDAWSWIVKGAAGVAGSVTPTAAAASGGYVHGPGTSTSDSILARLSNGEFVINAASVRRLGVGFLRGLNQFATGGLVGMPPIRFAEGGLAAATAGGTPVHLHLGNRSFALAGQAGVVKALVSEAHAQQVRSAGVKPTWFAGRPGR